MSIGIVYWIIILLWLIFGLWQSWPTPGTKPWTMGGNIVLFILLVLLGWRVFGPPIHS